ncbi:50S ribosomal protein L23 [Candidatus Uhrbacteria bacterium]|nr:50S ribosomal protein L23 [Candidatus Uhrbacteria bacterium]
MALLGLFTKKDEEKKQETRVQKVTPAPLHRSNDADAQRQKDVRLSAVLQRPLVTEKGTRQNALNQYAFVIAPGATKVDVRAAVEAIYGVRAIHVTVAHVRGRDVRYGRTRGRTKAWKKAIVTLPEGKKIQVHEGV